MKIPFLKAKKNKPDLDETFSRVTKRIKDLDQWDDPKRLEHYILDSCEQIVSRTREVEAERRKYRLLTSYLKDIETLSEMPSDKKALLAQAAGRVTDLGNMRVSYQHSPKALTPEEFMKFDEEEGEIEKTIDRMKKNEVYQAKVLKDIHYLEAEKGRIELDRDELSSSGKKTRAFAVLLLVLVPLAGILAFFFSGEGEEELKALFLTAFFLLCLLAVWLYMKEGAIRRKRRASVKSLNRTISLLNVERMKYASVTTALDYVEDAYRVGSGEELALKWEQYKKAVKDQELYRKNNKELDLNMKRMASLLSEVPLRQPKIWMKETQALSDPKEMVEVKHNLLERRHDISDRIRKDIGTIRLERKEIDRLMKEHDFYVPEILEIIRSVDRICGLDKEEEKEKKE